MNILLQNPLGQMHGPEFLVLFSLVALTTVLVSRWLVSRADPTARRKFSPLPDELGEYEIAYLRGGEKEAIRLAVLSLVQQGYFAVTNHAAQKGQLVISESKQHHAAERLSGVERIVFDGLAATGAGFREGESSLIQAVENHCAPLKARLQNLQLLAAPAVGLASRLTRFTGATVLLGLAIYKIAAALIQDRHNVLGLVLIAAIGVIVLWQVTKRARLSARGRAHLNSLTERFREEAASLQMDRPLSAPTMLLLVGIFGFSLLEHTAFGTLNQAFRDEEARAAGGCGAGCGGGGEVSGGGSDGGGGGCGGGCGGCGGCG